MSLIANAKAKALKGNVSEAFKNEAGAIDLASIMVGIIVIGLIGGVIAATVFAVIPWAQDNAAKQQLDSVAAAQSAYIGLSSDTVNTGVGTGGAVEFGTAANLKTAKLFDGSSNADLVIGKTGTGDASHHFASTISASGKYFYITDAKTQPTPITPAGADKAAKQTAVELAAFKQAVNPAAVTATWTK